MNNKEDMVLGAIKEQIGNLNPINFSSDELRSIYYCIKSVYCFGDLNIQEKQKDIKPLFNKLRNYYGYNKRGV